MGDNTEMGTLAVTEELHAKQQEAARKEAERAASAAGRGCGCEGRSRGTSVEKAAREGAARLHDRRAGAGHEDGRRWFPAGL